MVPNLWFFRHIPSRRELTLSWPGRSKTPGPIRPFAPTGCARTPALPPDLAARTVAGGAKGAPARTGVFRPHALRRTPMVHPQGCRKRCRAPRARSEAEAAPASRSAETNLGSGEDMDGCSHANHAWSGNAEVDTAEVPIAAPR